MTYQTTARESRPGHRAAAGFSVAELTVSMGVLAVVMLAMAGLFEVHSRLGRKQMQLADMQQASRGAQNELIRMARMAGRGGLGRGTAPDFVAVEVRNAVSASGPDRNIAIGTPSSPEIRPGTDVLTIRGVINTPLYQVSETAMTLDDPANPTEGTVVIRSPAPTGFEQDLKPLADAVINAVNEPLILVSSSSDQIYAVVALDPGSSSVDDPAAPTEVVASFDIGIPGGSGVADQYVALSAGGQFPAQLRTTVFVGIVEEYRYYVREQRADPGDPASPLVPRLSRGRFLAATELPHPSNPSLDTDVADGIIDLQIAVGVDVGNDGRLDEVVGAPSASDDWLFNHESDTPINPGFWNPGGGLPLPLSHLRITTMARTDRPDPRFNIRAIDGIEDNPYNEMSAAASEAERRERLHRRRQMTTVVDLRNQG